MSPLPAPRSLILDGHLVRMSAAATGILLGLLCLGLAAEALYLAAHPEVFNKGLHLYILVPTGLVAIGLIALAAFRRRRRLRSDVLEATMLGAGLLIAGVLLFLGMGAVYDGIETSGYLAEVVLGLVVYLSFPVAAAGGLILLITGILALLRLALGRRSDDARHQPHQAGEHEQLGQSLRDHSG